MKKSRKPVSSSDLLNILKNEIEKKKMLTSVCGALVKELNKI
jgi:hypothetical protein